MRFEQLLRESKAIAGIPIILSHKYHLKISMTILSTEKNIVQKYIYRFILSTYFPQPQLQLSFAALLNLTWCTKRVRKYWWNSVNKRT